MKPFNLEEAKAGKPVCTRDGRPARIICFDAKSAYPIVALTPDIDGDEIVESYTADGYYYSDRSANVNNLMMAGEKHEGWINIYKEKYEDSQEVILGGNIYNSEQVAKDISKGVIENLQHIATIKIEWEE